MKVVQKKAELFKNQVSAYAMVKYQIFAEELLLTLSLVILYITD